jgi:hypothetical protein
MRVCGIAAANNLLEKMGTTANGAAAFIKSLRFILLSFLKMNTPQYIHEMGKNSEKSLFFFLLKNFQFLSKNKNKPPLSCRSVCCQEAVSYAIGTSITKDEIPPYS